MNEHPSPKAADFWDRLAARTQPAGALATIENPRTIALLAAGALGGASLFAVVFAAVLFASGEMTAGWITAALAVAYITTWIWHASTGRVGAAAGFALMASVANQIGIHLALGGYANSGGYLMWGITMTFALAMMMGRRSAISMAIFYVVAAVGFALAEEALAASRPPPPRALSTTLFAFVLIGNLAMVSSVLIYFLRRLAFERNRAERLLLNVLPAEVAAELKEHGEVRAVRFPAISVLFADIVGFTSRSAAMDPADLVNELNAIFTYFDGLAERYGCEKIRTIGDGYMVASGVPVPGPDHAQALAAMALEMIDYGIAENVEFRIGINSGPAVAGVIGTSKFQYDVWGDTVNTASRMESHGVPGRVQISAATYELIGDDFLCTPRGEIDIKGKGTLPTWFLEGRRTGESDG